MLKKVITLTLLLQVAAAFGQASVTVKLPASGDFALFTSHGLPTEPPSNSTASKGGPAALVVNPNDDTVSVWDRTSGNIASRPVAKIKTGWNIADKDFDHIAQVQIVAVHDGSPVAAGEVSVEDGLKREPEILDSKSAGTATFFDVNPGRIIGTVKVKSDKGGSEPVAQVMQCPLVRSKPIPQFTVAIAQQVDVVGAAAATTKTDSAPGTTPSGTGSTSKTDQPPNVLGQVIVYVVALGIAVGVGYAIVSYFKKSPGTVSEKLEQLGVQIPKPDDQDSYGGPPTPISLPKPEPPQKIMLDDAAPTPLSAPYPGPSIDFGTIASEPTLLNSAGIPIPLMEGETVVGRDIGLGLSLTGESTVSRKHASVQRRGNEVTVQDHGSTNGTFVNGARLQQAPATLRPGDSVQFGSVAFRFQG